MVDSYVTTHAFSNLLYSDLQRLGTRANYSEQVLCRNHSVLSLRSRLRIRRPRTIPSSRGSQAFNRSCSFFISGQSIAQSLQPAVVYQTTLPLHAERQVSAGQGQVTEAP